MFNKHFTGDLEAIIQRVNSKGPGFAFTRFADGEHAVMERKPLQGYDWSMKDSFTKSSEALNKALDYRDENYYYGVSCACCDQEKYDYYKKRLSDCWDRVTYSNLFVNGNYGRTIEWMKSIPKIDFFLMNVNGMAPHESGKVSRVKDSCVLNIKTPKFFPSNVLEYFENEPYNIVDEQIDLICNFTKKIVMVSVGPLSEILIHYMYSQNKDNYYIDVGSVIDPMIHGDTRIYHHNSHWQNMICSKL